MSFPQGSCVQRVDRSAARRGTALVMVMIVATTVAVLSAAILQLSSVFTRRQMRADHDSRAFYLAEASLSEAYYGLTKGNTGQIGSIDDPARLSNGVIWVDATTLGDGMTRLEATALTGIGQSTLAIHVQRTEQPIGVFAMEELVIDSPVLLDGFDSKEASYVEQTGLDLASLQTISIEEFTKRFLYDGRELSTVPYGAIMLFSTGEAWLYVYKDEDTIYGEELDDWEAALAARENPEDADPSVPTMDPLGPTTGGGGQLGSNGNVVFDTGAAEIFGDVVPGPNSSVQAGVGVEITGLTRPRRTIVEPEPVDVPDLTLEPGIEHSSVLPYVVAPMDVGYDFLRLLPGAEAAIRGPATIVLGRLELADGSVLAIENLDGAVNLVVLDGVQADWGSNLLVDSEDPARLTLQVAGQDTPVNLFGWSQFHGSLYAPGADVWIEAPFEVFGVLVAGNLRLGANVRLHFDSGIAGQVGPFELPRLVSWEIAEVPAAVRARSIDRFHQLGLDAGQLASVDDAQQSLSWQAVVTYKSKEFKDLSYEGPYEEFTYEDVKFITTFELTPPDVEFADPWTTYMRYLWFGTEREYDGPVADAPTWECAWIVERVVTPPTELLDQGYEPVRFVATETWGQ